MAEAGGTLTPTRTDKQNKPKRNWNVRCTVIKVQYKVGKASGNSRKHARAPISLDRKARAHATRTRVISYQSGWLHAWRQFDKAWRALARSPAHVRSVACRMCCVCCVRGGCENSRKGGCFGGRPRPRTRRSAAVHGRRTCSETIDLAFLAHTHSAHPDPCHGAL